MPALLDKGTEELEEVRRWIWPRPITFNEFLDLYMGRDDNVELVDGTVVERRMVQYNHESLLIWLLHITDLYARKRDLGVVLGSRTAVEISLFRGRLPDLIFVSKARINVIEQKALFQSPDLVVEIRSPGNRKSHMIALETDYRTIGANEIIFIDPIERTIRCLRKRDDDYDVSEQKSGVLEFETIPGLRLNLEWLFDELRPDAYDTVTALLSSR